MRVVRGRDGSILERPVEPGEPGELEQRVKGFIGKHRAPVPSRRQPSVDARTGVEEVVGAATVKGALGREK